MQRIGRAILIAGLLAGAIVTPAAGAGPDRFVESGTDSGVDEHWTDVCGETIEFTRSIRATYLSWATRYEVHWQNLTTLVGPAGTLLVRNNYSFGGPFSSVVEDPEAGTITESGEMTTTGARVFVNPANGAVFTETGLSYESFTAVIGPGEEFSLTIDEAFRHGAGDPLSPEAFDALVCGALVGA